MRKELIDILLLGCAIALIALAIHALTDTAAPYYRLLALALAGTALFGVQLGLAFRRARQQEQPPDESVDHETPHPPHNRNNPFFRELTRDWIGLDEQPPAEKPSTGALNGESVDDRPSTPET